MSKINQHTTHIDKLKSLLLKEEELDFSVLIGSRANGTATAASDWDIVIQWPYSMADTEQLSRTEVLRHSIATLLDISAGNVDLVNAPSAKLAMRALIANEGIELTGAESLAWRHYLQRTWRELEDYYWDDLYVA